MLIYDYALDPYHCSIRILAMCMFGVWASEVHAEQVRILDYFLVYPSKVASIRLPAEYKTIRYSANEMANPYRYSPSKRAAFERMRPVFYAAASGLVAAGLLDLTSFERGVLKFLPEKLSPEMAASIQRYKARQSIVGNFVLSALAAIPLNGPDGLKHRTGLLEYRYDIV